MLHRLVEAHAEGEQHAERDRHIHVGAPVLQGLPGRTEEYPAGIGQRGQRDDRRQPMKQVAGFSFGARPDRYRKQHDIARGEARDRKGAYQLRKRAVLVVRLDVEQMGLEAGPLERFDKRRRRAVGAPTDGCALGRKIDARAFHAGKSAERLFDRPDASAAMNCGYRQIGLAHAIGYDAACEQHFLAGCARIRRTATPIPLPDRNNPSERTPNAAR